MTDEQTGPSMRLQRYLSLAGVDARRRCEDYIRDGRVTIDGQIITNPAHSVTPEKHIVSLDGERVTLPPLRYYLLNKPTGYLCTHNDPAGRARAIDLVPQAQKLKLFTVGRLDENTEGLLLVTNDGELANRLAHPRYSVQRVYEAQVVGIPSADTLRQLKKGLHFSDGKFHLSRVHKKSSRGKSTILEVDLKQGRNREIRRLFARVGHKIIKLKRIAFGPLRLGRVAVGKSRPLKDTELNNLRKFVAELKRESLASPPRKDSSKSRSRRSRAR